MTLSHSSANAPSRLSLPVPKDCQNPPKADQRETSPGSAESLANADSGQTPHCPTCICGRRAPVQASRKRDKAEGTIAWWEHEQAWAVYGARYSGQSAERIAERGGFSYGEVTDFLGHEPTTWSPRG